MIERSRNIMVGLTTFGGLAALCVLLLLFGYVPRFMSPGYVVTARMSNTQGINDASRVWLYGIDVGQVEKIGILPFPQKGVQLSIRLHESVKIPQGTLVSVNSPLLGGSPSVVLDTSAIEFNDQTTFLPTDGSAILDAQTDGSGLESRVAIELRAALESASDKLQNQLKNRLEKFDVLADKFDSLSSEWTQVGVNLNQLITPRTPGEVDDGSKEGNLASAIARIDDRVKELATTIESLNKWTADEQMREDFQVAVANARKLTEKMDTSLDNINKVTTTADQNIEKLSTRFIATADDLSKSIASMQKSIDELQQGKGTAGKLLNDPALYNNLNDSVQRIGKAADEFKIMMEKWRKEGLPLQF